MRLTKDIPCPKLTDKKRDQVGFSISSFLDSPVNLDIPVVGEIISECTRPQTADQPVNCSDQYSVANEI